MQFIYGYIETDDDNDDEIDESPVLHFKDKGSFTSHCHGMRTRLRFPSMSTLGGRLYNFYLYARSGKSFLFSIPSKAWIYRGTIGQRLSPAGSMEEDTHCVLL